MTPYEQGASDTREAKFSIGDKVQKLNGYRFPGIVRSVYCKGDGEIRYDVEADNPEFAGMLHIFSEAQLIPRMPVPDDYADPGLIGARAMRGKLRDAVQLRISSYNTFEVNNALADVRDMIEDWPLHLPADPASGEGVDAPTAVRLDGPAASTILSLHDPRRHTPV